MELALEQHIVRLLYDHECVIVPNFGAFLSRYHSAEVNAATRMMRPPSRRPYFNAKITENDGLLAKSISLTEGCSYNDALDFIQSETQDWRQKLAQGHRLNLHGIGRLFLDERSKLQFSPSLEINFERSSYGLAIFRTPAVDRDIKIRQNIQRNIDKHLAPAPAAERKSPRIPWAAVLGPVIFAGIIGLGYYTWQQDPLKNFSGLSWIGMSHSKLPDAEQNIESPLNADEESTSSEPPATESTEVKEELSVAPEAEIPLSQIYPYHIVVGSFKDAQNAKSYVQVLRTKGYDAYMAEGDHRYSRVAIGNFATREQADMALTGVRQNLNAQAWIYAN